jgi:exodeoxyribonuclease VII small subunit
MAKKPQFDFAASVSELEEINNWFQQEDIDLDLAVIKIKRGKEIVASCRQQLNIVENEIIKIKP